MNALTLLAQNYIDAAAYSKTSIQAQVDNHVDCCAFFDRMIEATLSGDDDAYALAKAEFWEMHNAR